MTIYHRTVGRPGRATIITTFGVFIAFTLVTVCLFWWLIHQNLMAAQLNHLHQLGDKLTRSTAYQAIHLLEQEDKNALQRLVDGLTHTDGIISADIYRHDGDLVVHAGTERPLNRLLTASRPGERYFAFVEEIVINGTPSGFVRTIIDRNMAESVDDQNRRLSLFLAFMMTVIASAIFFYLGHYTALFKTNSLPKTKKPESLLRERQHHLRPFMTSPAVTQPRLIVGSTEYNIRRILPLIANTLIDGRNISALSPQELNIVLTDKKDIRQLAMLGATIHQLCFEHHVHNFFVYITQAKAPTLKLPLTGIFVTDETLIHDCDPYGKWHYVRSEGYWLLEYFDPAIERLTERRVGGLHHRQR